MLQELIRQDTSLLGAFSTAVAQMSALHICRAFLQLYMSDFLICTDNGLKSLSDN